MADEDEDGGFREFSALLKSQPKCGQSFNQHHSIRGKGSYNRHHNRGAGLYGQERTCNEAFASNNVGYREGWHNGRDNGFRPASDPLYVNEGLNNRYPRTQNNNHGCAALCGVHQSGYRILEHGHKQQNAHFFGERLHGQEGDRSFVRSHAGSRTRGRGYHQVVSRFKDRECLHVDSQGWKFQPDRNGKQVKDEVFAYHRGKWGGRGHFIRGRHKRFGVSLGNSKIVECVDHDAANATCSSHVDAGPMCSEGKSDEVCTKEMSPATCDHGPVCSESESQEACPIQNLPPVLWESGSQKEVSPVQEEVLTVLNDQRHLKRAFISCIGGNKKRQRSSAVRDFPVRSGPLRVSVVKKVIKKTIVRKSVASRDLVLADPVPAITEAGWQSDFMDSVPAITEVGSQSDLAVSVAAVTGVGSQSDHKLPNMSLAVEDHVNPELTIEDSEKPLGKNDCLSEPVRFDLESTNENARMMMLYEGNFCAKPTQARPGSNIQICSSSTSPEESGKEQHLAISGVNNVKGSSKGIFPEDGGFEVNCEVTQRQLLETDEQFTDKKDQLMPEDPIHDVSCQITSPPNHVKPLQATQVGTLVSMHISPFENEHLKSKERKITRRTEMQIADGLSKSKSRTSKVEKFPEALTHGLHNQGHVPKKLKVHNSSELTEETGALILYRSSDGGNMRNKDFRKRVLHKGSRAKLFQTSKSLDPDDAAKLSSLEASQGPSYRALVKRTLHEFESIRKALVKSQTAIKRADLDAAAMLREKGKWRNCDEKIVGEVPGVEVGDQFSFRMEMLIIGLHRQIQSGIDFIPGKKRHNGSPLATSIVASGGYEDDKDDGNTLIYSGQGGNNFKGNKRQESNQELVRGNLALSNSMKENTPVRVIRGSTDLASPSSKVYTYDGLYDVVNCAFECGAAGFWVYQFTLTRRPGQPQVGLSFLTNLKKKGLSRPHLLLNDISRGQERVPVCVVNEVDQEPAPLHFSYISSMKYPSWYSPLRPQGCRCAGICDEETCSCAIKNGGELPYNERGYLMRDKDVVFECGPSCSCSSSCENRVSQKGLRYRLEIFKTMNRGWGVRSLDSIQSGGFICEYIGELLSDAEAEKKVSNDEYLFDLGNKCNPSGVQSDETDMGSTLAHIPVAEEVAYTIDAKDFGNVARFINHSCSPNLYAQNVLYDSDDVRFPHIMLFAMESIPPMRELTYDYNYSIDQVRDAHGNVKIKACHCGAQDCQGRLY